MLPGLPLRNLKEVTIIWVYSRIVYNTVRGFLSIVT